MMAVEIVEVRLSRDADGAILRDAPFMVFADERSGLYVNEPDVLAQLAPDEDRGRFEAMWDGEWRFGRRVADA